MNKGSSVGRLDHFAVQTGRLQQTIRFYEMIGLKNGARPNFEFHGAWLYSADHPVLHLVEAASGQLHQIEVAGAHHIAFASCGFEAMKDRLTDQGVGFDCRAVTADGAKRIFVRDPNGVLIELNYAGD